MQSILSGALRYLRTHHLAMLALFIAMGGSSYAVTSAKQAEPAATQRTIYACVTAKHSTFNLSSRRARCPKGQKKIYWNVMGVNSRNGSAGPIGPTGSGFDPAYISTINSNSQFTISASGPPFPVMLGSTTVSQGITAGPDGVIVGTTGVYRVTLTATGQPDFDPATASIYVTFTVVRAG